MDLRILIAEKQHQGDLQSLYRSLKREFDQTSDVTVSLQPSDGGPEDMGGAFEAINAVVANIFALSSLCVAVANWLGSKAGAPMVLFQSGHASVPMADSTPNGVDAVVRRLNSPPRSVRDLQPPDPDESRALLIGVAKYNSSSLRDIPQIKQNITGLWGVLTDSEVGGFLPEHCVTLSRPQDVDSVDRKLEEIGEAASDTLVVYYSGHGLVDSYQPETLYLALPRSERDRAHTTSLSFAVIRRGLRRAKAKKKVLILDCCMSGLAVDDLELEDFSGVSALTATAQWETALAPAREEFTAFTGEVISILRNGIPKGPQLLTLDAICEQARINLTDKNRPIPNIRGGQGGSEIVLARNRAYPGLDLPATSDLGTVPPGASAPSDVPFSTKEGDDGDERLLSQEAADPFERVHRTDTRSSGTAGSEPRIGPVKIGLWGATSSGKTTLLAALAHAADDLEEYGSWRIHGVDRFAERFLVENKRILVNDREFPSATEAPSGPLRFRFSGRSAGELETQFIVEIQDLPGGYFEDVSHDHVDEAMQRLIDCDGLVCLLDPIREMKDANNVDYFFGMLHRISTYLEESGRPPGRYLPHHVSVCVTKFDSPEIFLPARAAFWGTQDSSEPRFPQISEGYAHDFFVWICRYLGGKGQRLDELIAKHFDPARSLYFVTSSIGFYAAAHQSFNVADFVNVEGGKIRGEIRPINILEPFILLERTIRESR